MFWPSLAQKPWLWLDLRWLWPAENLGQAKAATHGLALAQPGPSCVFWHVVSFWTWGSPYKPQGGYHVCLAMVTSLSQLFLNATMP
jgi:hypothetical protein